MKVKPMIFNSQMVQALLEGRKTQTRRIVQDQPVPYKGLGSRPGDFSFPTENSCHSVISNKKNGADGWADEYSPWKKGDLIYVRETFQGPLVSGVDESELIRSTKEYKDTRYCHYKASGDDAEFYDIDLGETVCRWKPSIHMPRWASRLTLKVTSVRVERVQDISKEDAESEGFKLPPADGQGWAVGAVSNFRFTWEKIYGDSWKNNDWVWVIEFEVIHQNVDEYINETGASK